MYGLLAAAAAAALRRAIVYERLDDPLRWDKTRVLGLVYRGFDVFMRELAFTCLVCYLSSSIYRHGLYQMVYNKLWISKFFVFL